MSARHSTFAFDDGSPGAASDPGAEKPAAVTPTVLDYLLILAGCCLSLVLIHWFPVRAAASSSASVPMQDLIASLPAALRLTEGIILLWPLFFLPQKLRGRSQGLTAAEWLWVLSWVGIMVLTSISAWQRWGTLPGWLEGHVAKPRLIWYMIAVPSMAVLALLLMVAGMVRRIPPPWTHTFSLGITLWPVLPLAGILAMGKLV